MFKKRRKSEKEKQAETVQSILTKIMVGAPIVGVIIFMFVMLGENALPFMQESLDQGPTSFEYMCQNTAWFWGGCEGEMPKEVRDLGQSLLNITDEEAIRRECYCEDVDWGDPEAQKILEDQDLFN